MFQEILEDIFKNKNLALFDEDESSCVIANLSTFKNYLVIPNELEESVSLIDVYDGFPDTVHKKRIVKYDDLESALLEESFYSGKKKSLPTLDDLQGVDLTLLGVFIQPVAFIEDNFEESTQHNYTKFKLLVEATIDEDPIKVMISAYESGWVSSSFSQIGNIEVESAENVDINNALYLPNKKLHAMLHFGDVYVGTSKKSIRNFENILLSVDAYGEDVYNPSGFVVFNLPSEELSKMFIHNENIERHIASLNYIDLAALDEKQRRYSSYLDF